jgi:hypothetical protein
MKIEYQETDKTMSKKNELISISVCERAHETETAFHINNQEQQQQQH